MKKKVTAKPTEKRAEPKPAAKKASKKATPVLKSQVTEVKPSPKRETKSKTVIKKTAGVFVTKLIFQLRFHTKPGESLFITGNHALLGNNNVADALPLQYLNDESWVVTIDVDPASIPKEGIEYNYVLKHQDNFTVYDWGKDKKLTPDLFKYEEVLIADSWNHAGYFSNAFYTEPFQNVLLKNNLTEVKIKAPKNITHIFKIKAPLLKKGETVCMIGSAKEIGNWSEENPVLLSRKIG